MMVLTTTDPPAMHNGALPVIAAALLAVLAAAGVPPLGALPFPAVLFMLSSLAGAIVARGSAYPGRFSIHILNPCGEAVSPVYCVCLIFKEIPCPDCESSSIPSAPAPRSC